MSEGTSHSGETASGAPVTYATRVLGRPTKSGRIASDITKQELETHFHIPVDVAAARLGVGVTKLKAICRGFGIMRWPYRRIRRLQDVAQRILVCVGAALLYLFSQHVQLPVNTQNKVATMEEMQEIANMLAELNLPATSPLWASIEIDHDQLVHALASSVQVHTSRWCVRVSKHSLFYNKHPLLAIRGQYTGTIKHDKTSFFGCCCTHNARPVPPVLRAQQQFTKQHPGPQRAHQRFAHRAV